METTIKRKLTAEKMLNLMTNPAINVRYYERTSNTNNLHNKGYYDIKIRHSEDETAQEVYKKATAN